MAETAANYEEKSDKSKNTILNSNRKNIRDKIIWKLKSNKDTADFYSNNKDRDLRRAAQKDRESAER